MSALTPALSRRERVWGRMSALIPSVTAYAMVRSNTPYGLVLRGQSIAEDAGWQGLCGTGFVDGGGWGE